MADKSHHYWGGTNLNLPQHVRHDEEPHVATPNIDLVEMRDTAIASCDGDILELHVHVVLGCSERRLLAKDSTASVIQSSLNAIVELPIEPSD